MKSVEKSIVEVLHPSSDEQTVHIKTVQIDFKDMSEETQTNDMSLYDDETIVPSINLTMNPFQEEATKTLELSHQLSLSVNVEERYQQQSHYGPQAVQREQGRVLHHRKDDCSRG